MAHETVREKLSDSASRSLKACQGCATVDGLAKILDDEITRSDGLEKDFAVIEQRVSKHDVDLAVLTERVLLSVDGLRREFAAAVTVSQAQARGRDPRDKTPAGKLPDLPELKVGPASLRAPIWAVFLVAAMLVVTVSSAASVAYVASKWGPPAAAARK